MSTPQGAERILADIGRGVGPATARKIVSALGDKALDILTTNPDVLDSLPGVTRAQAAALKTAIPGREDEIKTKATLFSLGVGPRMAEKLWRTYGVQAATLARNNPYRFMNEIRGVGFPTADKIAMRAGVPKGDPKRVKMGMTHVLVQAKEKGHVFLPRGEWLKEAGELLSLNPSWLTHVEKVLASEGRIRIDGERIYPPRYFEMETRVAEGFATLARGGFRNLGDTRPLVEAAFLETGMVPTPRQTRAVEAAVREGLTVITGGPGTGKTTVLGAVYQAFRKMGVMPALAAPTGKAARRMSEAIEAPASTVHRLIFEQRGAWDALVVDEASMLDLSLADMLLHVHPPGAPLVLVGDPNQLPPVEPGDVLGELIRSRVPVVVELDRPFRQHVGGEIANLASAIHEGAPVWRTLPAWRGEPTEVIYLEHEDSRATYDEVIRWTTTVLPEVFGMDPREEVQVLSPFNRGPLGTTALNTKIRDILNPYRGRREATWGGKRFRPGDKVIRTKNSRDIGVYNGDPGTVLSVRREMGVTITEVDHDGRVVAYPPPELAHLSQAWALSVHKAQGSEYEAVVIPLVTQHYVLLTRRLLYTAVTRARKKVVLIGSRRAMALAVNNAAESRRHTVLAKRMAALTPPRVF